LTFNINSGNEKFQNPCDSPILRKIFKDLKPIPWKIVEKETIDEIIFRTQNQRNLLILELMARGGMRIGEVLRHSNLPSSQRYLGKVPDLESRRWIENLHG
jgi:hypothetical protein